MANTKITSLTALTSGSVASGDLIPIVDVSDTTQASTGTTKKLDASAILFKDVGGTVTAATAITSDSYPVLRVERTTSGTTGVFSTIKVINTTTGDMADGFGCQLNFSIRDNANTDNDIAGVRATRNGSDTTGDLSFLTGGISSTKMLIDKNGNVGIGTTSPASKLDVAGTVQVDALRIDQTPTAGTFTNTHYITVNLNGTTYRIACAV